MIIMKNDLPKMHYHIKKHLKAKSGQVKKSLFSRTISEAQYKELQEHVDLKLACIACLNFHANAVIKTTYQLKHNKRMYYLVASGEAIYAGELTDSKTKLNHSLAKLGIIGDSIAPLSAKLDDDALTALRMSNYDDNLTQARIGDVNSQKNIYRALMYDIRFNGLTTYHSASVTHQVIIDILGLGAIQRLFAFNPDIRSVRADNHHLSYKTAHGQSMNYTGNKSVFDPDLIHTWVQNLIHNPWMTITKHFNHKTNTVTYHGLYHYLQFKVVCKLGDRTYNDHIYIINTALNQLMHFHPSTSTISCIGNNVIIDYKFNDKNNKHSSNKLMLAKTAKGLQHEVSESIAHPSDYQYNPCSSYSDDFGNKGSITYSQYADFKVTVISAGLSANNQPIIILKAE